MYQLLFYLIFSLQFFLLINSSDETIHNKLFDYYEYRHVVAEGVQKALLDCRDKFKWDQWNCPKDTFLAILRRNQLPSNRELGLTRALIASGIVLTLHRSCSYGNDKFCGCTNQTTASQNATFLWNGCDEATKYAFRVSKTYLDSQDFDHQEASGKISAHNYEVGRLAVKRNMKRFCKCHGVSGSCQVQTCWNSVPDMKKVGDYLKRKYRYAAKVGAISAVESNPESLGRELEGISKEKLVFVDASPDYCYEDASSGINGTLGRYCSRSNGSCDKLCSSCGYKIKREVIKTEKQCHCKFVYCCSVQCKRCPIEEVTHKCVRHV